MSELRSFDKDTLFIPGENNALVWEKTVFDPSVDLKYFADREIEKVYISHGHADHFRQASELRTKGAKVLAPKKEAIFVENPSINVRAMFSWAALPSPMVTRFFLGTPCKVDAYTEEEMGSPVTAVSLPGHSVGHHGFLLPNRIFFSGDALWPKEMWNFSPLPYMIDLNQTRQSLRQIKELDYTWLIPAHGNPLSREESIEHIDYHLYRLAEIEEIILNLTASPLSTEELAEILSQELNLLNRLNQYWLTLVVLKCFLCSLYERGLIICEYNQYKTKWVRKQ